MPSCRFNLQPSDERWQPGCRIFSMPNEFEQAMAALHREGVIAYATEAVFGLGCDPDSEAAVRRLLAIKQRPVEKGLILIAAILHYAFTGLGWLLEPKANPLKLINHDRVARGLPPLEQ